ncbi:MAG: hypothetical protein ABJA67_14460 [Chthonomonadales bacterium]
MKKRKPLFPLGHVVKYEAAVDIFAELEYPTPKLAALARRVVVEFKNVPYPGDDNIIDPANWIKDYEYTTCQSLFTGRKWQHVTRELMHDHSERIFWLSNVAMHYFMPAFLLSILTIDPHMEINFTVTCLLLPPFFELYKPKEFHALFSTFSRGEKLLIADIFDALGEVIPEDLASSTQWHGDPPAWQITSAYYRDNA